jgi:hypothetical protein
LGAFPLRPHSRLDPFPLRYYNEAESLQRQLVDLKEHEEREYRFKWELAQRKPLERLLTKQAREKQVPTLTARRGTARGSTRPTHRSAILESDGGDQFAHVHGCIV